MAAGPWAGSGSRLLGIRAAPKAAARTACGPRAAGTSSVTLMPGSTTSSILLPTHSRQDLVDEILLLPPGLRNRALPTALLPVSSGRGSGRSRLVAARCGAVHSESHRVSACHRYHERRSRSRRVPRQTRLVAHLTLRRQRRGHARRRGGARRWIRTAASLAGPQQRGGQGRQPRGNRSRALLPIDVAISRRGAPSDAVALARAGRHLSVALLRPPGRHRSLPGGWHAAGHTPGAGGLSDTQDVGIWWLPCLRCRDDLCFRRRVVEGEDGALRRQVSRKAHLHLRWRSPGRGPSRVWAVDHGRRAIAALEAIDADSRHRQRHRLQRGALHHGAGPTQTRAHGAGTAAEYAPGLRALARVPRAPLRGCAAPWCRAQRHARVAAVLRDRSQRVVGSREAAQRGPPHASARAVLPRPARRAQCPGAVAAHRARGNRRPGRGGRADNKALRQPAR
mmetsp:Transcript_42727/g.110478  ORF Transcript_42727/g.110478 Transcript_42727/m.110478 type:complete len:451 (-) Transcript_42727:502-1854(-)